jgi:hypothetical protein
MVAPIIANGSNGLQIIDISDPENPATIGSASITGTAKAVTVIGDKAYIVISPNGLRVVDVNPDSDSYLTIVGSVDTPGYAEDITVIENNAYVADSFNGLQVIDISDPENPSIIGAVDTQGIAYGVTAAGGRIFVADYFAGLSMIDISTPSSPVLIGSVDTPGIALNATIVNNNAYIADGESGLTIVPVPVEITPVVINSANNLSVTIPSPQIAGHYTLRAFSGSVVDELADAVLFTNIVYSTTDPTNQDVVATLEPSEAITVTNNSGSNLYTFSANGDFTFEFVDAAGNTGSALVSVANIDKAPPTANITYSTTDPTNQNVTATITLSDGNVTSTGGDTHTFTENGSFTFTFEDALGNTDSVTAVVTWIDITAPTATIAYSTTDPTNQDVTATLTPSETVTITNNGGSGTYTFTANGEFTFEFVDAAGNTGSALATVDNIDKAPPTGTIGYNTTDPTNQDVVATLSPSETVTITNNGGSSIYTFTANGEFTFEFVDAAGNTGTALATVANIDKAPPTATIDYSTTDPTNQDVTATLTPSETVTITNNSGLSTYTFTANGEFTFEFVDAAGNIGSALATVANIDKAVPTATIDYSTTDPTNQDVTATLTPNETMTITNNGGLSTYTFTANGEFTFEFVDAAGNTGSALATVANIDKAPPTGTIGYNTTDPTNQDVTATIAPSESLTIINNGGSSTYVFTANGEFTFEFVDAAGNTGTAVATVANIDKAAPTATIGYSSSDPTNQDVAATLSPSETVTITNNSGSSTYTFTANGEFTFNFVDAAGNTGSAIATVANIDKAAPTATIGYTNTDPTNQDVVATLSPNETVTITNNGGLSTYTFSANGDFTFEFVDAAGNTGTAVATVGNIDKAPPTGTIGYNTTDPTNQDVTATLSPSEAVTVTNNGGSSTYTFTANGEFTFNFVDAAGNTGSALATVGNIDKGEPTAGLIGTPPDIASTNSFEITVGEGIVGYRYKLDDETYSEEQDAGTPIVLSNLSEGFHVLSVVGKNAAGTWQKEINATIATWDVICKGNLNGDDQIDLADAMIALKAMSGIDTTAHLRTDFAASGADVNNNARVGVEEVLYIMQKLSNLR